MEFFVDETAVLLIEDDVSIVEFQRIIHIFQCSKACNFLGYVANKMEPSLRQPRVKK